MFGLFQPFFSLYIKHETKKIKIIILLDPEQISHNIQNRWRNLGENILENNCRIT